MELVNQTLLAAEVVVSDLGVGPDGARRRLGSVVAKATFEVLPTGRVVLTEPAHGGILDSRVPTDLGLLPSDLIPDTGTGADVILLGAAYGPGGSAIKSLEVSLAVGATRRTLHVFGDRVWIGQGADALISDPTPFRRMPLIWERAYGGRCDVWIDPHTPLEVRDVRNPLGTGFDAYAEAQRLAVGWQCGDGFPRLDFVRALPNLEHPTWRISAWDSHPPPYCWATLPFEVPAQALAGEESPPSAVDTSAGVRSIGAAHPDWRLPEWPQMGDVVLDGCRAEGRWQFQLPPMRVFADFVRGARTGRVQLRPRQLVLLPEENRFTVTYQFWFRFGAVADEERSFRLALE